MPFYIPTRTMFDEAVGLGLLRYRLKIADDELKLGQAETIKIGAIEAPLGRERSFAIVYKFHRRSGSVCALRCFKSKVVQDMEQRYEQIAPYFAQHAREYTVGFTYYRQGIQINFDSGHKEVYPVVVMDWVEGPTLLEKVDQLCRVNDKQGLGRLAEKWGELMVRLRDAHIAHGDLSGEDVFVAPPNDRLVLVDYDNVYIPPLAGMSPVSYGRIAYQHPDLTGRPFDKHMDHFAALVIYTSLVALREQPSLWTSRVVYDSNGRVVSDNILFRDDDFKRPAQSSLFKDLQRIQHPEVSAAVNLLLAACAGAVDQVPAPYGLFLAEPRALMRLQEAIKSDQDEQIVQAWMPKLETYPSAQPDRARVELAHHRLTALRRFRQALASDDDATILSIYDSVLTGYPRLTPAEHQRLELAQQRVAALAQFRQALFSDDDEHIVNSYDPILDHYPKVMLAERQRLELAQERLAALDAFVKALQADDDQRILAAYWKHRVLLDGSPKITQALRQRLDLAQHRTAGLNRFRAALSSGDDEAIIQSYDSILDDSPNLKLDERQILDLARRRLAALRNLQEALATDDDERIIASYAPVLDDYPPLSSAERQRLDLARRRLDALGNFRRALQSDDDEAIVARYDPILDGSPLLHVSERRELEQARQSVVAQVYLDAVVVSEPLVGQWFDLAVAVRQPSSPPLDREILARPRSDVVHLAEGEAHVTVRVQVSAPECDIKETSDIDFRLYSARDSQVYFFQIRSKRSGAMTIIVTLYQGDEWRTSVRVGTTVRAEVPLWSAEVQPLPAVSQVAVIQGLPPAPGVKDLDPRQRARLRELLVEHFSAEELRDLIFDLGLDHEAVTGGNKNSLARELVMLAQRLKQVDDLLHVCQQLRPDVPWGSFKSE